MLGDESFPWFNTFVVCEVRCFTPGQQARWPLTRAHALTTALFAASLLLLCNLGLLDACGALLAVFFVVFYFFFGI